jgi:hypothetical protein
MELATEAFVGCIGGSQRTSFRRLSGKTGVRKVIAGLRTVSRLYC